jgi:DNA-3-methyladenine glycosylase
LNRIVTTSVPLNRADSGRRRQLVERELFAANPVHVAPRVLNLLLVANGVAGRVVEVEAYDGERDAASHAYRGETPRNATMFGPPGHLYVYFTYGMHYCSNIVCCEEGVAGAVLLRALAPISGLEEMRARRPGARRDRELCAGPARLCQALGIDRTTDGADLVSGRSDIRLVSDGTPPPRKPLVTARIGLSDRCGEAVHFRWRFAVRGDENVSRPAPRLIDT